MTTIAFMLYWIKTGLYGAALVSGFFIRNNELHDNNPRRFLFAAVFVHLIFIIMYVIAGGHTPAHVRYDASVAQSFILGVLVLFTFKRQASKLSMSLAIGTILLISIIGIYKTNLGLEPHMPSDRGITFLFFHLKDIAVACFACCFSLSAASLIRPSENESDTLKANGAIHMYALWGFIMFSVSQLFGSIWAVIGGYGDVWIWRPMHLYSAMIWIFYAAMLHTGKSVAWPEKTAPIMGVIGFVLIIWWWLFFDFVVKPAWHSAFLEAGRTGGLV